MPRKNTHIVLPPVRTQNDLKPRTTIYKPPSNLPTYIRNKMLLRLFCRQRLRRRHGKIRVNNECLNVLLLEYQCLSIALNDVV